MICTVTFNPSLDYIVSVDDFQLGMTNRTSSELILPGGKGINVSIVLKNLGLDSTALGYAAGFTGEELIRRLNEFGVNADFIKIDHGMTRINLKLKSIDGTEINGCGPDIDAKALEQLMEKIDRLGDGDVLVLAGSIPYTMPDDIYQRILERIQGRGVLTVVDATRDLLVKVLPYHPFLVKPNNHELGDIFGVKLSTREEVVPYGRKLQEMGAQNVLISMAGEDIGNQRFCIGDKKRVLIAFPENTGKIRCQDICSVFSAKTLIEFVCGENDPVVKIPDQSADFLHVFFSIGTADQFSAWSEHTLNFAAYSRDIFTVKKHMVCNDQIKASVFMRNSCTVKCLEGKTAVFASDSTSGITKHSG